MHEQPFGLPVVFPTAGGFKNARQPKPWYREDLKVWCVTIAGKRHNLGRNKKEAFTDLLRVNYETGCRPQESLPVEARHLDLENQRWVFPCSESKVKSMPRNVYLTEFASRVPDDLAQRSPTGPCFVTREATFGQRVQLGVPLGGFN